MPLSYALFPTALGTCALAWSERGFARVSLPEESEGALVARLSGECPGARPAPMPPAVAEVARRIARHLGGAPQDFADGALDPDGAPAFQVRAWEAARAVAAGRTATYGELARALGSEGAARAVGRAMALNRFPLIVPCHRVLAADGSLHGFTAHGGLALKRRLLAMEGVAAAPEQGTLFEGAGALPFSAAEAARAVADSDPALAALVERVGPLRLRLRARQSPFASLAESIVYQQLSGRAAEAILRRLRALFGVGRTPSAAELRTASDAQLRAAGLSRAKVAALRDLAEKALSGEVPTHDALLAMDDAAIVERLTAVRGVGRWTVEMLLIFRLGRPDVLPSTDLGIRRGLTRALGRRSLLEPAQVERRGERWRPWRSAASWYLWEASELPEGALGAPGSLRARAAATSPSARAAR